MARTLIGYGGSQSLESPGQYSREAKQLIEDIGIETDRFYDYFDRGYFKDRGMQPGIYFSRESYGQDKTLPNALGDFAGDLEWEATVKAIAGYPISETSKASLVELLSSEKNYLADIETDDKVELLRGMSYDDFLRRYTHAYGRSRHDHSGLLQRLLGLRHGHPVGARGLSPGDAWYLASRYF